MLSDQTDEPEQLIFAALADPMRRRLLLHGARYSPKTATELARDYPIPRQGILKHLTLLEAVGLVSVHQAGREKRCSLTPEPLGELEHWINEISAKWDARLLRLKIWLEQEQADA